MESFLQLFNNYENTYTIKTYFENGQLKTEIPYKDNLKNGTGVEYRINGSVYKTIQFKDGEIHGWVMEYYNDNTLYMSLPYNKGYVHGI